MDVAPRSRFIVAAGASSWPSDHDPRPSSPTSRSMWIVHGRFRQPCPRCGAPDSTHRAYLNEMNYCPRCQTNGQILSDRSLAQPLGHDWPRTPQVERRARAARPGSNDERRSQGRTGSDGIACAARGGSGGPGGRVFWRKGTHLPDHQAFRELTPSVMPWLTLRGMQYLCPDDREA